MKARSPPAALAPLFAVAIFGLLLTGALADHVYSHRFVVAGRLIGSDGLPLPGRAIGLETAEAAFTETCREGDSQVTDDQGDFEFCYHVHDLEPSATVTVSYGDLDQTRHVDLRFRKLTFFMQVQDETGTAPENWNATYRVGGRAWVPGTQFLEGVEVKGIAVIGLPVNLTVTGANATPVTFETTTNEFGDFDLLLELQESDDRPSVTLEARGMVTPVQLNEQFHRTFVPLFVSPVEPRDLTGAPDDGPQTVFEQAPGASTPRVHPVLWLALAVGVVGAIVLARKKKL